MEKIKDFLYNKNDLIIALLILAGAAAVIYFRIRNIMAYDGTQTALLLDMAAQKPGSILAALCDNLLIN